MAKQRGLPVRMDDPRYMVRYQYASALTRRMHLSDPYGDAIRARGLSG